MVTLLLTWQTACLCCALSWSPVAEWSCLSFFQIAEFPAQALLMAYGKFSLPSATVVTSSLRSPVPPPSSPLHSLHLSHPPPPLFTLLTYSIPATPIPFFPLFPPFPAPISFSLPTPSNFSFSTITSYFVLCLSPLQQLLTCLLPTHLPPQRGQRTWWWRHGNRTRKRHALKLALTWNRLAATPALPLAHFP